MRCRYTQYALDSGISSFIGQREGEFIGLSRNGRSIRVKWDGNKTVYNYHKDFIEIILEQSGICVVDLSRAPILRELISFPEPPPAQPKD
jgi:hypothetical protein